MGTIKNLEDLEIWIAARELVNLIYSDFKNCRDFTFKNQITGAGISIDQQTRRPEDQKTKNPSSLSQRRVSR